MTSLMERFIPEAREHVQAAAKGLLKLERNPADEALVNEVFRAVHTLKGASGLFDVPGLTRLVHASEDVLGAVRSAELGIDGAMVDMLLDSLDWVSRWIDALEQEGRLPENSDGISSSLALRLRVLLPAAANAGAGTGALHKPAEVATWLVEVPDALRQRLHSRQQSAPMPLFALTYTPDEGCFYRGEDPVSLVLQLTGLEALHLDLPPAQAPISDIDPYRCDVAIKALVSQPREEIEHLFRYVMDQLTIAEVAPSELLHGAAAAPSPASDTGATPSPAHAMAARMLAEQIRILSLPLPGNAQAPRIAAVEATVASVLTSCGLAALAQELPAIVREGGARPEALRDFIVAAIARVEAGASPVPEAAPPPPSSAPSEAAVAVPSAADVPPPAPADAKPLARTLRVDQGKIDTLMNLIGELIVSKNSLAFLAKRAEGNLSPRELAREIKDQHGVIDRLSQEMQRAIMDVRMLPVSEIFERFPRLVRDLSRKLGKRIELTIEGEETAADKTVIEVLADPLIHLVRNSIDHGIELPEARLAAGKPETATLELRAFQEGDQVIIEVRDDGKGIDPAIVKAKALDKGLITRERAAALSDSDAVNLVFLPGFSTASEISDLSGRGVGMDVVRTVIDRINGQVSLVSQIGRGTVVRLSLPLSMAVTRIMTIEVAGSLFGTPMDNVLETVRVPIADIRHIKRQEAFMHRGKLVPLLRLESLLKMPARTRRDVEEESIVVVKIGATTTGLVVDRFRERIEVILKPLEGILAEARAFSGSAMLGDGRVLLVLNLKELL